MKRILQGIWVVILLIVVGLLTGVFSSGTAFHFGFQTAGIPGIVCMAVAIILIAAAPRISRYFREKKGIEAEQPIRIAGTVLCGIGALIAIYG